MKLLNDMTEQLKVAATSFIRGEIDLDHFYLRIDLLIDDLYQVDINLDNRLQNQEERFKQLHQKARSTAISNLTELKHHAQYNRRLFNSNVRKLVDSRLYHKQFFWTIRNNLYQYDTQISRKEFQLDQQLFVMNEYSENDTEVEEIDTKEDLSMLTKYYEAMNKIRVTAPPFLEELSDGTSVLRRHNGTTLGYKFSKGASYIDPEDLDEFMRHYPQWKYGNQEDQNEQR